MESPPVEPDLVRPWNRGSWIYGLRTPFSLVFVGWLTLAQAVSPKFNLEIYLFTLLSAFLGYMSTDTAQSILLSDLDIPCTLTARCAG